MDQYSLTGSVLYCAEAGLAVFGGQAEFARRCGTYVVPGDAAYLVAVGLDCDCSGC